MGSRARHQHAAVALHSWNELGVEVSAVIPRFLPRPGEKVAHWHIAPWIDTLAYAFSWLPFLLPVAFLGESQRRDYLVGYLVVLALTDVHRHYGFPYVYLDREVFRREPVRFSVFPLAMLAAFVATPLLIRRVYLVPVESAMAAAAGVVLLIQILRADRADLSRSRNRIAAMIVFSGALSWGIQLATECSPAWIAWGAILGGSLAIAFLRHRRRAWIAPAVVVALTLLAAVVPETQAPRMRDLFNAVAVFAGVWNIWHVYMQKYGILRLYAAKATKTERVPGWVDRLLIFAWLPLYLVVLGTTYRGEINRLFSRGRSFLRPLFEGIDVVASIAFWPAVLLVAASIGLFLYWEWRAHGFRNAPRLVMATGTTLLASTFLLVHPLKAYLAYAISHAIEYMVFVWAFQRQRYREPLPHRPLIQRFLRFPILTYVVSAILLGLLFTYWKYYGRWIGMGEQRPRAFGFTTYELVGYWTVYQSMVHFYFDGFLWKMRSPSVRAAVGAATDPPSESAKDAAPASGSLVRP